MKKAILGGLLGGLALFVWGMISHMALPLGTAGVRMMPPAAEGAVLAAMKSAMSERALYIFPGMDMAKATKEEQQAWQAKYAAGPAGIIVFNPKPQGSFPTAYMLAQLVDHTMGWFLAGLVLARVCRDRA